MGGPLGGTVGTALGSFDVGGGGGMLAPDLPPEAGMGGTFLGSFDVGSGGGMPCLDVGSSNACVLELDVPPPEAGVTTGTHTLFEGVFGRFVFGRE